MVREPPAEQIWTAPTWHATSSSWTWGEGSRQDGGDWKHSAGEFRQEADLDPWEQKYPWRDNAALLAGGDEAGRRAAQELKQAVLGAAKKASSATSPLIDPHDTEQNTPYWKQSGHYTKSHGDGAHTAVRPPRGPDPGPRHDLEEQVRVIPEREVGETLVIGGFKGRTRTTTANAGARRALEIFGCDSEIQYFPGAPSTSSVVKVKMTSWAAVTRASRLSNSISSRASTPTQTAGASVRYR